jgi:hypothetical protein
MKSALVVLFSVFTLFAQSARFAALHDLNITNGRSSIITDLNNDEYPEIIAAKSNPGEVLVFLNDGAGNFNTDPDSTYSVFTNPFGLATGDFDEDGNIDLVVSCLSDSIITVFWGNGAGKYPTRVEFNTHQQQVYNVAVGDINNDQNQDIVALTRWDFLLVVFEGAGDGTFSDPINYDSDGTTSDIEIANLNEDLYPDVLLANGGSYWLIAHFNDGNGGFPAHGSIPTTNPPSQMAIADMDGDTDLDVVWGTGSSTTKTVGCLLNNGAGSFTLSDTIDAGDYINDLCVADIDGDENPDVVTLDRYGVYFTSTDGDGNFLSVQTIDNFTDTSPRTIAADDLDQNGHPDLVICHDAKISLYYDAGEPSAINKNQLHHPDFVLKQNYPNPFNSSTIIKYDLSISAVITIDIFNTLGQNIKALLHKNMAAGNHEVVFDGTNLPSGIYYYRIKGKNFQQVKKMILIK